MSEYGDVTGFLDEMAYLMKNVFVDHGCDANVSEGFQQIADIPRPDAFTAAAVDRYFHAAKVQLPRTNPKGSEWVLVEEKPALPKLIETQLKTYHPIVNGDDIEPDTTRVHESIRQSVV